ncbi:hypothetical protein B0H13DRAFT_1873220 [Mycena leptocephala]|nr:hypothetical protein B0H13DRAFT_1873220 [Mycena leptocephala]
MTLVLTSVAVAGALLHLNLSVVLAMRHLRSQVVAKHHLAVRSGLMIQLICAKRKCPPQIRFPEFGIWHPSTKQFSDTDFESEEPVHAAHTPSTILSPPSATNRDNIHPKWHLCAIMYMVAFLHTQHRVTFAASGVILLCLGFIFSSLSGNLTGGITVPHTLQTVFTRLEIKDRFIVHPICFRCHRVFETTILTSTCCPECDEEIFGAANAQASNWSESGDGGGGRKKKRQPFVVTPIQLLSSSLRDFFMRPGMVHEVNKWKTRERKRREWGSMQDDNVWKTIEGPDGRPFFFGPEANREIRIGVTFSLDWKNLNYGIR